MGTTLQIEQAARASERYAERVNREWVRLLDLLQMNVRYERCVGVELFTDDGEKKMTEPPPLAPEPVAVS